MLISFKNKIGLGTETLIDCSALPDVDSLNEIDTILYDMCRDEDTANTETSLLRKTQMRRRPSKWLYRRYYERWWQERIGPNGKGAARIQANKKKNQMVSDTPLGHRPPLLLFLPLLLPHVQIK